jgi:hypothetical protein
MQKQPIEYLLCRATLLFGLLLSYSAVADDVSPVAVVELVCKSSKGPTPEEDAACLQSLKLALLDKYISSLGPERQPLVAARKAPLAAEIDTVLQNLTIRSRQFDKKTKSNTLAAQADISVAKVNQLIDVSPAPQAGSADKNPIVFIFIARRQTEVETKSPKVTTGSKATQSAEMEAGSQSRGGEATTSTASRKAEATTTISSVTRTSDRIIYAIEDNAKAGIERTMSRVFVERGFDTVSAADLVDTNFNPDKMQKDFETSSEFSLENRQLAARVCRGAGAMLAYGTLTIGVQRIDPANQRNVIVNVIVDAVIFDCRKPLAIRVGSIGAEQVEGVGADQTQAETDALDKAASKAAQVLADQLRSRGIR